MPLTSALLKDDPRLQACLVLDAAHVQRGAVGAHVERIQRALIALDGARIADDELRDRRYGETTRQAVLNYKTARQIINRAYQTTPDAIVGKMTIRRLDDDLNRIPIPPPIHPDMPVPPPPAWADVPLEVPAGFRPSGWEVTGTSGWTLGVPTGIPHLSAEIGSQQLTLTRTADRQRATYKLWGVGAAYSVLLLAARLPWLRAFLDRLAVQLQSGLLPTQAFTQVLVTPWVAEPVDAGAFDGFAAFCNLSVVLAVPQGALTLVVFSMAPLNIPVIAEATIKGVALYGGVSLSVGLGPGLEQFDAICCLDR